MSPAIRAATPGALVAVTAIYDPAVRHGTASFELAPPDASEMARRRRALVDAGYPYLVAEIDGVIAGYAYAGPYRARPAYRWSVEDSIYVAPHMHRRGVGAAMLGRLIADTEQSGVRQMVGVIGDCAQAPSNVWHQAAGFRPIGTIEDVGFKFGRWLDS